MQLHSSQSGFTLVEMLVSLALYTIVVTTSIGSLLVLIDTNARLVGEQAVMSSLTFAMDSMTREIRTGKAYYCDSAANLDSGAPPDTTDTQDCYTTGNTGISFIEAGASITGVADTRIAYYFDIDEGRLYRRIGNSSPMAMTGDDINITEARFFVTGAAPLDSTPSDVNQPLVTIYLEAEDASGDIERTITLHTSIAQRELDL